MKKIAFIITLFCSVLFSIDTYAKDEPVQDDAIDNSIVIDRISNDDIKVTVPSVIWTFRDAEIKLEFNNPQHTKLLLNKSKIDFIINGEEQEILFVDGKASFMHRFDKNKTLSIYVEDFNYTTTVTAYPLWAILLPLGLIILWIIRKMIKK